jgi:hypothetical protein
MTHSISGARRGGVIRAVSLGVAIASLSAGSVLAGPHGGGGAGLGGMSGVNGNFGGMSSSHMSTLGRDHTNGPGAIDRDFGADRASDRSHASLKTNLSSNSVSSTDRDHGRDRASDRAHRHGKH